MNGRYLNDGCSDGQEQVEPIDALLVEPSPVRQVTCYPPDHLHIKGDGGHQFEGVCGETSPSAVSFLVLSPATGTRT